MSEAELSDAKLHLKDQQTAAMFFDEEPELELGSDVFVIEDARAAKPFGRRIAPHEIPAGHVDLGERESIPAHFNEFDIDDPEAFVGKTVKGRYLVTEWIGEENSRFSFLGEDRIVGDRRVVIHILSSDEGLDEITSSIFDEERVALSHINHPNIARLFDSGSYTNGTTYLISEHIDALTVDDILQIHGRFTPERVGRLIRQAAHAIGDVHNERILHRDIHPENIAIGHSDAETESVTVTGFGISSGEPNAGNLAYQAPERLDGRISTVATDIYSLAVIAYEMLTGRRPFDGESERELRAAQRSGTAPVTSLVPGLTTDVDAVFSKALSADPRARYVTAREFGDAFFAAVTKPVPAGQSTELPVYDAEIEVIEEKAESEPKEPEVNSEPVAVAAPPSVVSDEGPAWTRRSPEPIAEPDSRFIKIAGISFVLLLVLIAAAWYLLINRPAQNDPPPAVSLEQGPNPTAAAVDTIVPPLARDIPQPPNTDYYANLKQNLKGDLVRNFVGFKLYYPKDWKVNGPLPSTAPNSRGKFFDISKTAPGGQLREQLLISYYPSKGTFTDDSASFPGLVKETNETLKKMIPSYQMLSEGLTSVNGGWQAYEVKFQFSVKPDAGESFVVWGRRLFIPAQRPGVRNGFEVTMLATSFAGDVHSVDDVGVKGDLAAILYSFEPSQNF